VKTLTLGYTGTVGGYKRFGRKHILAQAFRGRKVVDAAKHLQQRLQAAQVQDRVCRALGGGRIA
jgi:hypothetical protein